MQHFLSLLAALLCLARGVADSSAHTLTSRLPAEGTPQARKTAEQAPAAAIRKQDWGATAAAWETRIARSSDQGFTVTGGTSVPPPSPPVAPVVDRRWSRRRPPAHHARNCWRICKALPAPTP